MLLGASYYFYMCWRVEYIFLLLASTIVDYACGIQIEKQKLKRKRRHYLFLSLAVNLGLLFTFKYWNFFSGSLNAAFSNLALPVDLPLLNVLLPVGISFYTFQTLSYTIDVYFGRIKAERHLGYFALYVSFFPQLVAGPIERYASLSPQFKQKQVFTYENFSNGFRLVLYGLFLKMVMADNFGVYVDRVYGDLDQYSSHEVVFAMVLYAFQIYGDFFGYSLVAIGSARILGICLMDNFKSPYLARNIAEFWQRWHISLSTWFRDYIYYPLGGNRTKMFRWTLNVLVVFAISGLWHGANWTFVAWGGIFAFFYLIEKGFNKLMRIRAQRNSYAFKHAFLSLKTFIFVCLAWVFFRGENLQHALEIFLQAINGGSMTDSFFESNAKLFILLFVFLFIEILLYNKRFDNWIAQFPNVFRWPLYMILCFAIIAFSALEETPFIYFQF